MRTQPYEMIAQILAEEGMYTYALLGMNLKASLSLDSDITK